MKKIIFVTSVFFFFFFSTFHISASCIDPIANPYGRSCSYTGKSYSCVDSSLPTNFSVILCCDSETECPSSTTSHRLAYLQFQAFCADQKSINTALGCIPYEYIAFTNQTLKWGTASASFFTFLIIVYASILMIINGHDPKKIQAGQEMITASLAGLAMIAICVLLVNYLGATLLNLGPLGFR